MPIYELDGIQPTLPPSGRYYIAPDAVLIGRVIIEPDASVWFGAVLRGDNEPITVGAGSNVQDRVVLHTDMGYPVVIGKGCTIGHSAILHGCVLGENCLVGMGATLLNGVKLGANCLVGANALVTEGKEFPDNSMIVGAPAKAIRKIEPAGVAMLQAAAKIYRDRWPGYVSGLKRID